MKNIHLRYHFIAALILLILLCLIANIAHRLTQPTTYTIDKTSAIYLSTSYFIDESKTLSLNTILSKLNRFTTAPLEDIKWRFSPRNYWLLVELENRAQTDEHIVAHFDNPMADHLSAYTLTHDNHILSTTTQGDVEPSLSMFEYSVPHINLTIKAHSKLKLLLKIDTVGISKTPINLFKEDDFQEVSRSISAIWGIFVGVLIMAALYNLTLYFGIKEPVYLVYIGYILSMIILMGSVLGYGFYVWPISWQLLFQKYIIVNNYIASLFTLAFCTLFLRYHKDKCWRYTLSIYLMRLIILLGICSVFIVENIAAKIFFVVLGMLYLVCFIMIYNKLQSGFRWTKFYILSWIPLVIGSAVQPLELIGVLKYDFLIRHAFAIAIMSEVVLMAIALADRVRYQRARAIYHASHTQQTKLLNSTMLKQAYMKLEQQNKQNTLCLIKMREFQSLHTLLKSSQSNALLIKIAQALELQLLNERQFMFLNANENNDSKVVDLGSGIFAFISTKKQSGDELSACLAKILKGLPKQYKLQGLNLQLEYAVGISFADSADNFEACLQRGYLTLKQAKNTSSKISSSQQQTSQVMDINLAAKLQSAINNNEITLYHQPQIELATGHIIGSEVLLRWPTPEHQYINIEELILLAERTGLINELTLWVLDKACQDIAELNRQGYVKHCVSVNLSAKNMEIVNLVEKVENILLKHNVPANQLKLELTETALINCQQQMQALIVQLSTLGIAIVLDDFGTGYASLTYLLHYTFTNIKIDRSFIMDFQTNSTNRVIVKTAIDMAHNLGITVTAEGVEDAHTQHMLKSMGANFTQGYYYSKPIAFDKYVIWLTENKQTE